MRLGQIRFENHITAALFEEDCARPIPGYTMAELIRKSETESISLPELAPQMAARHSEAALPVIPINPVEVWACGCTYQPSAEFRDAEQGQRQGIYAYVCQGVRPEIFFKGTARVCVGPGQPIGIRADSTFTAPEPELAVVLGRKGRILGYTLANDVSAWDLERENPLYLPQSKIYWGSCALGPVIVTVDELKNPYALEMTCTIRRGEEIRFSGRISTSKMKRKLEELVGYLMRSNPIPAATVLLTGTGIVVPEDAALQAGDVVTIEIPEIGQLANTAMPVE
jgi:2-dehydro-3-deoxy-D-arabinonate dehydratase